jgi:flagellar biosynthetic protein FliR
MITLSLQPIYAWLLIFLRVGLVLSFFPVLGERFVPVRVRIVLAGMIALALAPVSPVDGAMFPGSGAGLVALVAHEALLAFAVALLGRIMFAIVQFSGQIAGEQMGFGLVNALDPTGAQQVSVVAELQYVCALMLFFVSGMHIPLLTLVAWSFREVPPGAALAGADAVGLMMRMGAVMFTLSVGFAMPVIAVIFAINIGLGMVGRAVPQINVFMESFPLRIIAGLVILMTTLGITAGLWEGMFDDMLRKMGEMALLMKGRA